MCNTKVKKGLVVKVIGGKITTNYMKEIISDYINEIDLSVNNCNIYTDIESVYDYLSDLMKNSGYKDNIKIGLCKTFLPSSDYYFNLNPHNYNDNNISVLLDLASSKCKDVECILFKNILGKESYEIIRKYTIGDNRILDLFKNNNSNM